MEHVDICVKQTHQFIQHMVRLEKSLRIPTVQLNLLHKHLLSRGFFLGQNAVVTTYKND